MNQDVDPLYNLYDNSGYKCYKIKLDKIIAKNHFGSVKNKITECAKRMHLFTTHVYQFLRLFILDKYYKKETIPFITQDFIKMAFKCIFNCHQSGKKPSGNNGIIFNNFKSFFDTHYLPIFNNFSENSKNISAIVQYTCTDILTNIENNIKFHFINRLIKFVKKTFHKIIENILSKSQTNIKHLKDTLYNEIDILCDDLLTKKTTSITKYNAWYNAYKPLILPHKDDRLTYEDDLKLHPQNYIKPMIFMNIELERMGEKQFQFFPLRTDFNVKNIPLDTKAIIDLIFETDINNKEKNKEFYLSNISTHKDEIWKKYFNLDHKIFKNKNYMFNHMIYTDGLSVSLQFVYKKQNLINVEKNIAKQNAKNENKDKTANEKLLIEQQKNAEKLENDTKRLALKSHFTSVTKLLNKIKLAEYKINMLAKN